MQARFFVRGHDEFHDRGTLSFDCELPTDALREYLIAYVEDWRGGYFERLDLKLAVWSEGVDEQTAERWIGSVIASGKEHSAKDYKYEISKADQCSK